MKPKEIEKDKNLNNSTSSKPDDEEKELSEEELENVSGGRMHCVTGKHIVKATITV